MGKFLFLAAKSIFFISQFSEQHTSSPPGSLPRPPSSSSEPRSGANPNRFGPVIVCGFSKVPKLFKWFVKVVKYTDWMTPGVFFCCISEFQAISCSLCPFTTAWSTSPPWNEYEMDFDTCGSFSLSTTHQFYVIFKQPSIRAGVWRKKVMPTAPGLRNLLFILRLSLTNVISPMGKWWFLTPKNRALLDS